MAEELIYCPSCNHKLMLPEEMMGTLVQCPMCRGMFTAPRRRPAPPPPDVLEVMPAGQPSPPAGPSSPTPPPLPEAGSYHPPAPPPAGPLSPPAPLPAGPLSPPAPPPAGPFYPDERTRAADRYGSPYGAPPGRPPRESSELRSDRKAYAFIRVLPPAIGILIGAVLNLLYNLLGFFTYASSPQSYEEAMARANEMNRSMGLEESYIPLGVILGILAGLMFINLLIAIGAIAMMRLKIYALALITGILAIVNCTSPCCFVSTICGLWAVIMLVNPAVREGFD